MKTKQIVNRTPTQNQPFARRRTGPPNAATSRSPRNDEAAVLAWMNSTPSTEPGARIPITITEPITLHLPAIPLFHIARAANQAKCSPGRIIADLLENHGDEYGLNDIVADKLPGD